MALVSVLLLNFRENSDRFLGRLISGGAGEVSGVIKFCGEFFKSLGAGFDPTRSLH